MEWKIPNQDDFNNVVAFVYSKYERMHSVVTEQFGPHGWIVMLLFAFFIVLIIAIYIKSIIDTFRAGNEEIADENAQPDGLFYTLEEEPGDMVANDNGDDEYSEEAPKQLRSTAEELDMELSLNLLKASQEDIDETERNKISSDIRKRIKVRSDIENTRIRELNEFIKKQKEDADFKVNLDRKKTENIINIIINLLGRGVSIQKINQSLYYNYQNVYEVHDIIHTVQSVCNFIGLCNAGKLDYLPQRQMLPENDAALYAWANGDYSLALILLQSFLNQLMEQSQEETGIIKDLTYALASNCSCIIGDIAKLKDLDLAHNSFELATELSPKNVVAWSRLGDIYMSEGATEKAMIAYQNVMDIADTCLYAGELAHVKERLAAYYQKQEVLTKAEQLHKESAKYYDETGIFQDLTDKEVIVYDTVCKSCGKNLQQYIYSLLNSYHF